MKSVNTSPTSLNQKEEAWTYCTLYLLIPKNKYEKINLTKKKNLSSSLD